MKRMRIALLLAAVIGLMTGAAHGATGRYVDVAIERDTGPSFFGLGGWKPLEDRLIALRVSSLTDADAEGLASIVQRCAGGLGEAQACGLIDDVEYVLTRTYAITPDLQDVYRVALTNKTDALLGIVLEVDGLNTNGSAEVVGTAQDKKWILLPGQTVRISGWQVSTDEALEFRFALPSQSHSDLTELRGSIRAHVYLFDPTDESYVKGTEAGALIDQPTVRIPFVAATESPVERIDISYARGEVGLGFLCEETDGTGIRISSVALGTIAELKGLRAGDVITYINAVPIRSCQELESYLATKAPGDRVVLKVHREDRAFLLTLELQE